MAKANQLSLLQTIVKRVFIPEAVYREVVIEGKRLGGRDAFRVEKAIKEEVYLKVVRRARELSGD